MNLEQLKSNLDEAMASSQTLQRLKVGLENKVLGKDFYANYLAQTYHYTFHNSRNQALVAARRDTMNINYMKFCLKHAREETGHEMMALHDLRHLLGKDMKVNDLPAPLASTNDLVDTIYDIAQNDFPTARLGYSFWAERVYEYIAPLLGMLQSSVGIDKKAMTFFIEHADIDADHAIQVDNAIKSYVKTDDEWESVNNAMLLTLEKTMKMVDEIIQIKQ